MGQIYKGQTGDTIDAPFLSAKLWTKGMKISGKIIREFDTEIGRAVEVALDSPVKVNGKLSEHISLGSMKGLEMALQACGAVTLEVGDKIKVICTGHSPTGKGNPRTDFSIELER